jgi:hypothetical protein
MALDNSAQITVSDQTVSADAAANDTHTLNLLQKDAGLQDKIGQPKVSDEMAKSINGAFDKGTGLEEIIKSLRAETEPPSDKERSDAEKTLEGRMSKLIPEADRDAMKAMTTAITNGDTKAFAEAVKKTGGDPAKLKALVTEVDKMLEEKGCSIRLDVTGDGKVLVSDTSKETALAVDPKSGNVEAKSVEHNPDGSILVKPGEVLHVDTEKAFKDMGDRAVNAVNGKLDFNVEKHDPFFPIKTLRPIFPDEPLEPYHPHEHWFPRVEEKPWRQWDQEQPFVLFDDNKIKALTVDNSAKPEKP